MEKIHEKSLCCRGEIRRFGGRRQQCKQCLQTWTRWPKRRGRKRKRVSKQIVVQFLQHGVGSAYARQRDRSLSARTITRDIIRSRDLLCRTTSWPTPPNKAPFILIADAVIKRVGRTHYTAYCLFIRTPREKQATILPPTILAGGETQPGWNVALHALPPVIRDHTMALVCDGHRGTVNYAKRQKWVIQRCHFHLIAAIQGRRSRWTWSRHREESRRIFEYVYAILEAKDDAKLGKQLHALQKCAFSTSSPQLRKILIGFINNYAYYRSYLYYPHLNLPTTTNTAESFISSIEELCHRLRGFPTPHSFFKWTETLVKFRKKIVCNGNYQQKN